MEFIIVSGNRHIMYYESAPISIRSLHTRHYLSMLSFITDLRKKTLPKKPTFLLLTDEGMIDVDPEAISVLLLTLLSRCPFPIHLHYVTRKKSHYLTFKSISGNENSFTPGLEAPYEKLFTMDYIPDPFLTNPVILECVLAPLSKFEERFIKGELENKSSLKIAPQRLSNDPAPSEYLSISNNINADLDEITHKADIALWTGSPEKSEKQINFLRKNSLNIISIDRLPRTWEKKKWESLFILLSDSYEDQMEVQTWLLYAEKCFPSKEFEKKIKILLPCEKEDSLLMFSPIEFLSGCGFPGL